MTCSPGHRLFPLAGLPKDIETRRLHRSRYPFALEPKTVLLSPVKPSSRWTKQRPNTLFPHVEIRKRKGKDRKRPANHARKRCAQPRCRHRQLFDPQVGKRGTRSTTNNTAPPEVESGETKHPPKATVQYRTLVSQGKRNSTSKGCGKTVSESFLYALETRL
jgi:hypothetical protein